MGWLASWLSKSICGSVEQNDGALPKDAANQNVRRVSSITQTGFTPSTHPNVNPLSEAALKMQFENLRDSSLLDPHMTFDHYVASYYKKGVPQDAGATHPAQNTTDSASPTASVSSKRGPMPTVHEHTAVVEIGHASGEVDETYEILKSFSAAGLMPRSVLTEHQIAKQNEFAAVNAAAAAAAAAATVSQRTLHTNAQHYDHAAKAADEAAGAALFSPHAADTVASH